MVNKKIRINQPVIDESEIREVSKVLETGILTTWHGSGERVSEFEKRFASYIGVEYAIAVNSGTAALHTALAACGIGHGDEVIVPAMTFVATANVVLIQGARPVFVDVDPETLCMDPEKFQNAITDNTKAVIPVHVYGCPAEMDAIMEIAEDKGLIVIEDAAQAHGALYKGRKVGSIGHMGCFSFFASKNMTTGEGGIITTNDAEYARKCRLFRTHGQEEAHMAVMPGLNYRMTEFEAAIGLVQLSKLDKLNAVRARNAETLANYLKDIPGIMTPTFPSHVKPSHYVYTIRVKSGPKKSRDALRKHLVENGIEAAIYWPNPVHLHPLYMGLYGYQRGSLPISEEASDEVLSLPVHPKVSVEDLHYIAEKISEFFTSDL
ncbi:MAG: DegT/DnrJ/EryC1/StrS family aminotransferase [Nitrososphaerota archaeon]|nr:DegT/DnrJ/EryC1/StrS family aminotransferase [Aigarchaeota archaeon]MDW8076317.1 DegT/DnrJ/EryC1/StrS family aminotransferase [Nitrososphaerota archaeon]